MRKLSIIECIEVAGGSSSASNDIVYVAEVFPPLTPEAELGLFMFLGACFGGVGGFVAGATYSGSGAVLAGTSAVGAVTGLFTFPFIAFGIINLVGNGFNSVKSFYI